MTAGRRHGAPPPPPRPPSARLVELAALELAHLAGNTGDRLVLDAARRDAAALATLDPAGARRLARAALRRLGDDVTPPR